MVGSTHCTFNPTSAYDSFLNGQFDAFVVKVNAAGTSVIYKTYLGGDGDYDVGRAIALNPGCASSCEAFVTGQMTSGTGVPVRGSLDSSAAPWPIRATVSPWTTLATST
jgi:hypothetical protein